MKLFIHSFVNFDLTLQTVLLRSLNIALSFFLLFVTTGFTVSKHFCHDRLVNTGIFKEAESCHEIPQSCCSGESVPHCSIEMEDDDCCKDENELVKFDAEFTVSPKEDVVQREFINASAYSNEQFRVFYSFEPVVRHCGLHQLSLPTRDILALIQVFLI